MIGLTVSSQVSKDIHKFIGEPAILVYDITTSLNETTEDTIQLPINWKVAELPEVLKESFLNVPGIVTSVHIKSYSLDYSKYN